MISTKLPTDCEKRIEDDVLTDRKSTYFEIHQRAKKWPLFKIIIVSTMAWLDWARRRLNRRPRSKKHNQTASPKGVSDIFGGQKESESRENLYLEQFATFASKNNHDKNGK